MPNGEFILTERDERRAFALESALINLCDPAGDDFADGEVKPGVRALHIKVGAARRSDDEYPPSIAIGPLLLECLHLAELVGRRLVLPDGYEEEREKDVATIHVHAHDTLGPTEIEIVRVDGETVTVRVDAICPDTDFYDDRARPGRIEITADCTVTSGLRV